MIRIKVLPDLENIFRWPTLNDDLRNGSIIGVITVALVCVAMILFSS